MLITILLAITTIATVSMAWHKIQWLGEFLFYKVKDRFYPLCAGDLVYDSYFRQFENPPGNEAHIKCYNRVMAVTKKHYFLKEEIKSTGTVQGHFLRSGHSNGNNVLRWVVQREYCLSNETKNARQLKEIINGK